MRLTAKLTGIFFVLTFVLLGMDSFYTIRQTIHVFEEDAKEDLELLGMLLSAAVKEAWRTKGKTYALELVNDINRGENIHKIRWIEAKQTTSEENPYDREIMTSFRGEEPFSKIGDFENEESMFLYQPVFIAGKLLGAIEIAESLRPLNDLVIHRIWSDIAWSLVLLAVGATLVFVIGSMVIGRPIEKLVSFARKIGKGDFQQEIAVSTNDELSFLAREMNSMCALLKTSRDKLEAETKARSMAFEKLRQADRLAVSGRMASAIAHELGTPLNVVAGRADLIERYLQDLPQIKSNAGLIKQETEKMTRLVRQFLDTVRRKPPLRQYCSVKDLLYRLLEHLAPLAASKRLKLELTEPIEDLEINIDAAQIQQALTNILVNAIQASKEESSIEISAFKTHGQVENSGGKEILIVRIKDYGSGICEEHIHYIFDPFFTTKDVGEGTGLGLSIAHEIISEHGGRIEVSSKPSSGSTFEVKLPLGEGYARSGIPS